MSLSLEEFFKDNELPSVTVDLTLNLNEHYVLSAECVGNGHKASKMIKYIPMKSMSRKESMKMLNMNNELKKYKLRADIADKIYSFECYYENLFSKILKRKYEEKKKKLEKYRCFAQYDYFEVNKLESVLGEINLVLDF